MLKTVLKAVLPTPAKEWASRKRLHAKLVFHPKAEFDASKLNGNLDLQPAFAQSPTWADDHAAIASVYGSSEVLAGVNPGDRRCLYHLIRYLKPRRVLETGTHVGASTIHIARALKANGSGSLITVDIGDVNAPTAAWAQLGLPMSPHDAAKTLGCKVSFIAMPAQDYMRSCDSRFDFIFLDGDHAPAGVYAEVSLALRLLNPGGYILLHDYHESAATVAPGDDLIEGPYLAMKRISRENRSIGTQPLGELPWPTKAGSHRTSLTLVVRR